MNLAGRTASAPRLKALPRLGEEALVPRMAAEVVALDCSSFLCSGPAVTCRGRHAPEKMGRAANSKAFNFHSTFAL